MRLKVKKGKMDSNLDKMRQRIFDIADPNVEYSQKDFEIEFDLNNQGNNFQLYKVLFNYVNKSNNPNPEYATIGSSGFDIRANTPDIDIKIEPFKRFIVPTGLFFEIPENFEIQIRPRSGLAAKNGVTVLNTPGTIDSDYRGEIKVILINLGDEDFIIHHGDRIAQAVISPIINKNIISLIQTNEISDETERSSGGFGSTGLQ